MACKKCKKICKFCLNVLEADDGFKCGIIKEQKLNCITGKVDDIHFTCEELNADGNCSQYRKNEELILETELIKLLSEYINNFMDTGYRNFYEDEPQYSKRDILYACLYVLRGESCEILDKLNKRKDK